MYTSSSTLCVTSWTIAMACWGTSINTWTKSFTMHCSVLTKVRKESLTGGSSKEMIIKPTCHKSSKNHRDQRKRRLNGEIAYHIKQADAIINTYIQVVDSMCLKLLSKCLQQKREESIYEIFIMVPSYLNVHFNKKNREITLRGCG